MELEMPGIIFWGLILILYWILTNIFGRDKGLAALPLWLIGFVLTAIYIFYAAYWIYSHWDKLPISIHLT
jgi:hypothetical protein